jgi:hypothetical protein
MLPDNGSGIIVTNKLLFEAPLSGYVTSATIRVPDFIENRGEYRGYTYVRSQSPAVYHRINWTADWSYKEVVSDGVTFSYETVTNPYGERNLEEYLQLKKGRGLPIFIGKPVPPLKQLTMNLENEARKALDAGRLAEKPDLKRLIDEAMQKGK